MWRTTPALVADVAPGYREGFSVSIGSVSLTTTPDYATEDRLISIYQDSMQRMAAVPFQLSDTFHAYAYPKTPGLATDHRQR